MVNRHLHWSAIVGVACSLWLLLWLCCIEATLFDIKQLKVTERHRNNMTATAPEASQLKAAPNSTAADADHSGRRSFIIITGVFALWTAYRAKKRLALLRHGEFSNAAIVKRTEDSYDYNSGVSGKVNLTYYRFMVNNRSYSRMLLWTLGLKRRSTIPIVYNTRKPDNNECASRLRARFDPAANEWRSSMWHVMIRIALLVIMLAGIPVLFWME